MERIFGRTRVLLGWALIATSLVVLAVALGARTVRQYGERGDWGATTATDGLRNWQGWVFLAVLLTWVVLVVLIVSARQRLWLLLAPIAGLVWAAESTRAHFHSLLAERAGPRTYPAEVPVKPPFGPIVDERGFPLFYDSVVRVYDVRIPAGIEFVAVGCLAMAGLTALLLIVWCGEDLIQRRATVRAALITT